MDDPVRVGRAKVDSESSSPPADSIISHQSIAREVNSAVSERRLEPSFRDNNEIILRKKGL